MKVIRINTPDGQYLLPLKIVAEQRAEIYANKDTAEFEEEVDFVMDDDFEGIDYILNNTDYEDWEESTVKLNSEVKVLSEDFWRSSDDLEIIDIEESELMALALK